jgi:hypothetical protein
VTAQLLMLPASKWATRWDRQVLEYRASARIVSVTKVAKTNLFFSPARSKQSDELRSGAGLVSKSRGSYRVSRFINPSMKELEPLPRIDIRF